MEVGLRDAIALNATAKEGRRDIMSNAYGVRVVCRFGKFEYRYTSGKGRCRFWETWFMGRRYLVWGTRWSR